MIAVLAIAVALLFIQQFVWGGRKRRPAFTVYILAYFCACVAYDPISRANWVHWADLQSALGMWLLAESFWKDWRDVTTKWWGAFLACACGGVVAGIVVDLEWKFGGGIEWAAIRQCWQFTAWAAAYLAASVFAKDTVFDLVLAIWLAVSPISTIAFWWTASDPKGPGTALHQYLNALGMLLRAAIVLLWIITEARMPPSTEWLFRSRRQPKPVSDPELPYEPRL